MKQLSIITKGKIVEELKLRWLPNLAPLQFLRIEKKLIDKGIINPSRRTGGNWRVYTEHEATKIKNEILKYYGII